MFTFSDIWGFIAATLIIYPVVVIIHELGHTFFTLLFGGRTRIELGRGRKLFDVGPLAVHSLYFLDSALQYTDLKWSNRFTHFLVHIGGVLFNIGSIFLLNQLILEGILENRQVYHQFSYFSLWFAAYAAIPVDYGDEKYSDGMSAYLVARYRKYVQLQN
ncbi:hypothetical protein [Planococcus lenghuensis]|uniref:Peptidase M50 domain-containing protein n=1 Tax=Planococcus lenghuensis TaxID=2213202 RepID=A0A1Q2KZZ8_9BACL|nr:hypothetical protein [Planococcus lenghuensis]AQQ53775.1 hypothetical protein B0X71_12230 [Planococcus lenghuensis]